MAIQSDKDIIENGRKNALKDVEAPLRERINSKLLKKLEELNEGHRTVEIWNAANADRADRLARKSKLLAEYDEFLEPIYSSSHDWSSTLHLPVALTMAKTFHARFVAALLGMDPPFTVKGRKAGQEDRAALIQELMRFTLKSWINKNKGIDEIVDNWLWDWIIGGSGILKGGWEVEYTRYIDVVTVPGQGSPAEFIDPVSGEKRVMLLPNEEEIEKEVTKEIHNCPTVQCIPEEDIVIVGGNGDPQDADEVIQQEYKTAGELWSLVDQKIFREEAVEKVIQGGESLVSSEQVNSIKIEKSLAAGYMSPDKGFDTPRYQILERHTKIDVDGSGIPSEVILWVHKDTAEILRATYLRRVNPTGLRPFFKIDFHKRFGQETGVGLIELLYSLTKELDAMHNMKIDFGLISSMPFGFYRPTASLTEERMPLEPGSLIPLDNPQSDVYFPQLGNRSVFAAQEEAALYQMIERFTAISDMSLGIIGGQGAARTATGARALLGESNANLDVYLRRMNRGWSRFLIFLFHKLQQRLPKGFQFRILGDDGNDYWAQIEDPRELEGMYDFELEANSANSNKQVQIETANQIYQITSNPMDIQLGIITPLERFEAIKNLLQVNGVKDYARFVKKPDGYTRIFSPIEVANRVLAGIDVKLGPEQDLQGFIEWVEYAFSDDEILGQFTEQQTLALDKKSKEAMAMLEALQKQQAQIANAQQIQTNTGLSTQAPMQMPQGMGANPAQMATGSEG
jgi:hypothetical protein